MSSIIPKINIGAPKTFKSADNLSFDCQTTANIGAVQPSLCRELVPHAKAKVSCRTLVRLASMPVPTFGRLSQRDYYTFVRMSDLYEPWAEFLASQPYTNTSGTSYTPTKLPFFAVDDISKFIFDYSYFWIQSGKNPLKTFVVDASNEAAFKALIQTSAFGNVSFSSAGVSYNLRRSTSGYNDPFGMGCFIAQHDNGMNVAYNSWVSNVPGSSVLTYDIPTPSYENADFIIYLPKTLFNISAIDSDFDPSTDGLYLCLKLKPIAKHLRQIMIGCGYQFNPFEKYDMYFNPFKLFAFYKSWFDLMRPTRDVQFTNTTCYTCLSRCKSSNAYNFTGTTFFAQFLYDLAFDTYFYTQPDYFSASISSIGDTTGVTTSLRIGDLSSQGIQSNSSTLASGNSAALNFASPNSSLVINAMLKLMRFTSKNNVIGRSIRDYVKVHYGIDDVEHDNKSVNKIGAVRCDIFFDDVMSNAATSEANLGEYGGKGIGIYPKNRDEKPKKFIFEAPDYGYFICLSVIVPEAGYYQGYMLENKHLDKFHFWSEEYDAVGYQILEKGEIKSDYEIQSPNFDPSTQIGSDGFGFIPRYSEYKVGRNIVNGDLTLRSSRNGLDGYFLDKRFASIKEEYDNNGILQLKSPDYIPNSITQQFRKIDPSDNVGNYNRIFNYTKIDEDHFIIQKVFDFKVSAPWKSLSNSFDTIQEGEDVIERNHQ